MNYYMPTRLITGKNCVTQNVDLIRSFGKKCIIVTGKSSAKKCGALDDVINALGECCEYVIFDKIEQNPSMQSCIEGGKIARDEGAQFVIGIGGGSPLDAAKAIAVFATNDFDEKGLYSLDWAKKTLPVIAVGTTAGTGSEVTQVAVITTNDGLKKSFRSDYSFPVIAFGDARYTEFMPDSITRSTAVDALSHCMESYFNKSATDISRAYAVKGSELILDVFKSIVNGVDITFEMREQLYMGSILGGLSISVTGTAFPHALGYFLTEGHGLNHGTACAVYLGEFIDYNKQVAPTLYADYFSKVGVDGEYCKKLIADVLPLPHITVSDEEYDSLRPRWQTNNCLKKVLGDVTPQLLENIVKRCIDRLK